MQVIVIMAKHLLTTYFIRGWLNMSIFVSWADKKNKLFLLNNIRERYGRVPRCWDHFTLSIAVETIGHVLPNFYNRSYPIRACRPGVSWPVCRAAKGDIVQFVAQVYDFFIISYHSACASHCILLLL